MRSLPEKLPTKGLLAGRSLEPPRRKPAIGFITPSEEYPSPAQSPELILDSSECYLINFESEPSLIEKGARNSSGRSLAC